MLNWKDLVLTLLIKKKSSLPVVIVSIQSDADFLLEYAWYMSTTLDTTICNNQEDEQSHDELKIVCCYNWCGSSQSILISWL